MPLFQPRYARLGDAFEDTDIKTEEGDLGDDLDNIGDEVEINVLIETNRTCEKRFIAFNSSQPMGKIRFRSKVQLLSPAAICPTLNAVRSGIAACGPCRGVGAVIMGGLYKILVRVLVLVLLLVVLLVTGVTQSQLLV